MKKAAWADFEDAKRSFYFMAREIDELTTVSGKDMILEPKEKPRLPK